MYAILLILQHRSMMQSPKLVKGALISTPAASLASTALPLPFAASAQKGLI